MPLPAQFPMIKIFAATAVLFYTPVAFSQSSDPDSKNIVISQANREFRFVTGNADAPVQIKEESSRTYYCNDYRNSIGVVEFYNDKERIDDVDILVDDSKKHGIKPANDYYSSDGIFYSDARICYFTLPLVKKGSTSKVTFSKTYLDPHYFTSIHFMEGEAILKQEIKIIVPSWMNVEFKEFNFSKYNISKDIKKTGDETIYTYSMKDIPAMVNEPSSPGFTYYAPHLLVMTKFADTKAGKITYFNTLKDQYDWYHKLVLQTGNDASIIKEKAAEITQGLTTESDKVKAIFLWVQDNIRYIAFEDGVAGFRPEKAQEVLRKKYGDCKGMANLVTEMLRAVGADARKCWIGTKHLAYDYTTPSIAVDNHMISAWMNNGKPVFLDATEKYIGLGEVAERIQGRQTLIEDGDKFLLTKVPVVDYHQNTANEKRVFSIEGTNLKGHVVQNWKGENKEGLLTALNSIKKDKQENALIQYLSEGNNNFEITGLKVNNLNDYNRDVNLEYDVNWKNALSQFGKDSYLEIDNRRKLEDLKVDTSTRKLPFWLYYKSHLVFETEINIPETEKISNLPEALAINRPGYSFTGNYVVKGSRLNYKVEIVLQKAEIRPEEFAQWNKDISQLKDFYNQQIVLTKTK
jgi:hypothetical protein